MEAYRDGKEKKEIEKKCFNNVNDNVLSHLLLSLSMV